jgi:hypothetical protein
MRRLAASVSTVGLLALGATPLAAQIQMAETVDVEFQAVVVDTSCKLVYNLIGEDIHRQCAQVCADNGIPLALLADDGTLYLPVTQAMPGEGANALLRPHAEHRVTVRGKKLTRDGVNAIIIESVRMRAP